METEATLKVADELDALELSLSLCPEELAELRALEPGRTPLEALQRSMRDSDASWAAVAGGEVGAMFGVGPLAGVSQDVGQVWFLTGEAFRRRPLPFARVARQVVGVMLEFYPVLFNAIDARYAAAVRWAEWLGFDVGAPQPFGPAGVLVVPARLRRDTWARW